MQKSTFTRWFLVWFLAAILLLCVSLGIRVAAATGRAQSTPATDPPAATQVHARIAA